MQWEAGAYTQLTLSNASELNYLDYFLYMMIKFDKASLTISITSGVTDRDIGGATATLYVMSYWGILRVMTNFDHK